MSVLLGVVLAWAVVATVAWWRLRRVLRLRRTTLRDDIIGAQRPLAPSAGGASDHSDEWQAFLSSPGAVAFKRAALARKKAEAPDGP